MEEVVHFKKVMNHITNGIFIVSIAFICYILFSENMLDYIVLTGLPIKNIAKLFRISMVSNLVFFISLIFLGISFLRVYVFLKGKNIPFVGFIWVFGIFKLLWAGIVIMNVISLWRAYFWIDIAVRVTTTIFAAGAAISLGTSIKSLFKIRPPEQYQLLRDELERVRKIHEEVINVNEKK